MLISRIKLNYWLHQLTTMKDKDSNEYLILWNLTKYNEKLIEKEMTTKKIETVLEIDDDEKYLNSLCKICGIDLFHEDLTDTMSLDREIETRELLEISSKTVRTEISIYTSDEKNNINHEGIKYLESSDPACFELPHNTIYFVIKNNETLKTIDGKQYEGGAEGLSVYMGDAITIEEAITKYSFFGSTYAQSLGIKRVAIREDGCINPMFSNAITYDEYCEQYLIEQKGIRKSKTP